MSTNYLVGAEDDEALDILWGMVMEEGNENAIKNLRILESFSQNPVCFVCRSAAIKGSLKRAELAYLSASPV